MTRKLRARFIVPSIIGMAALAIASVGGMAGATTKVHDAHAKKHKHKKVKLIVEKPPTATIAEAGSSLMYPLWNVWAPGYTQTYPQVNLQTAAGGSGKGIAGALDGTLQIGASDAYLSTAQKQQDPTILNIPLAISAQEADYNIPNVHAHLKLNGKILAKMYTGKITKWNTSAIAKLNPNVTLPTLTIVPIHRSDGSGDTFLWTSYLSASTTTWATTVGFNTTVTWPAVPGGLAGTGSSGMLALCKTTPGCITYEGTSYQSQALGDGLTYGQLENKAKKYVLPTPKTIEAEASGFTKQTPATGSISMIDGKGGYPIVNYEYGVVSKKQSSSSEAKAVRSLLEWCIDTKDGNSTTYLSQVVFRPLPSKVITQSYKQIKKIK
ncbi:MAG TPA: phosphate ABC transporter substrate-binding protein PstS [Acidimicrobiales bacterium]|nr:phosphate ABC transporter substrate-binding protein PstS [Acidimicrobiales bacterium]